MLNYGLGLVLLFTHIIDFIGVQLGIKSCRCVHCGCSNSSISNATNKRMICLTGPIGLTYDKILTVKVVSFKRTVIVKVDAVVFFFICANNIIHLQISGQYCDTFSAIPVILTIFKM